MTQTRDDANRENPMGVLWGSAQIGPEIGLSPRQANHLLSRGGIPGVRKVGGRWCITRDALRSAFADQKAA